MAQPPGRGQEALWDGYFSRHWSGSRWARAIYRSAGVARRHPAVDPTVEDISTWGTGQRMRRYGAEAMPLAKEAAAQALAASAVDAGAVGLLAVVSCTGYSTPGTDIGLARDLGISPAAERIFIGHMGCHAALPALGAAADFVAARGQAALLLCVELPSLHVQPPTSDAGQILAHALFSDAAAAVVVAPAGGHGLGLVDSEARTDTSSASLITWEVTDLGFRMGLARQVPSVVRQYVGPVVSSLLARHGLQAGDVQAWCAHPGGPAVLDAVQGALGLSEAKMALSRKTLELRGNCSSATVLLELDELARSGQLAPGQHAVLLGFGPGLTVHAALLQAA